MRLIWWVLIFPVLCSTAAFAVYETVEIAVNVNSPGHWSYTKAFDTRTDYLVECHDDELLNMTPIATIMVPVDYNEWCNAEAFYVETVVK